MSVCECGVSKVILKMSKQSHDDFFFSFFAAKKLDYQPDQY